MYRDPDDVMALTDLGLIILYMNLHHDEMVGWISMYKHVPTQ